MPWLRTLRQRRRESGTEGLVWCGAPSPGSGEATCVPSALCTLCQAAGMAERGALGDSSCCWAIDCTGAVCWSPGCSPHLQPLLLSAGGLWLDLVLWAGPWGPAACPTALLPCHRSLCVREGLHPALLAHQPSSQAHAASSRYWTPARLVPLPERPRGGGASAALGKAGSTVRAKQSTPGLGTDRWTRPWGSLESNHEQGNSSGIIKTSPVPGPQVYHFSGSARSIRKDLPSTSASPAPAHGRV